MRYLLIGNGDVDSQAIAESLAKADTVIQINKCRHFEATAGKPTHYIFMTNTGEEVRDISDSILSLSQRPELQDTRIILARNPCFYGLKARLLKARGRPFWKYYQVSDSWVALARAWQVTTVSFLPTLTLDLALVRLGMPPSWMPSTGLVAYCWLKRRIRTCDSIEIQGFTFQGWQLHPWTIERNMVVSIGVT